MAAPIVFPLKCFRVEDEFDAGLFAEPLSHLCEDPLQVIGLFWAAVDDGEVEVFGEPKRFVVALAQAGPAFEDPRRFQLGVLGDASQQPAQDIVLLDHPDLERPLATQLVQFPS